ncbi:MAG: (2Fe-2S)-binding protein [Deltaproteobacteria bacterium]|nr:(2Fe-2S)-binding protein [Candidatus Zymogenaceae bacterium]
MSQETVTFTLDGVKVKATKGQTIMEAADAAGIYIPRLCWHKDLPSGGNCRICTVMVNGRPAGSCLFPVEDGIVVENNTKQLKDHRCQVVEMHFIEGNHYCPSCEASGECELQALGYYTQMLTPTSPYLRPKYEVDASHPDVYIDRDRCILCGRCIRASEFLDGKCVFSFEGRGIHKRISVNAEHNLGETNMEASDRAATICPTGALMIKRTGYRIPVGKRRFDIHPIGWDIEKKKKSG